ncbi:MAG: glycosyltransferase, partial [Chloroflexi bacterium]|nr:glycosyltransferase [Chloroflexota bacterium]
SNVKIARKWAKSWGLDNVKFITVVAFLKQEMKHRGKYDVVMCQEVLEHCPDAGEQLDALVPHAKAGALFILSTPTGPVEYVSRLMSDWDWKWRGHIQHLETADLFALFGRHPDFAIDHLFWQTWRDHPIGWSFMTFRKPVAPSGKLELAARLAVQAPRETLSVCIITRANTKTLAKCLEHLKGRADQIVIGIDMGADAHGPKEGAAWGIAEQYGAEAFGIVSPLEQGFDAARNETIQRAVGDWILWIDDDEDLIHPERLHKYLRPNCYDGYAILQTHFALEPKGVLKSDYPCRLFRNRRGMRFYGVVHEHPELKFNEGPGRIFMIPDVEIAHNGYVTEKARRLRFERNFPLMKRDREKYPERKLGRFLWLRDLTHQNRFDFEKFHAVTDEMRQRADEGIAVWRALVAEGEARLATDGLPYYSDLAEMTQGPVIEYTFATHVKALGGEKKTANPIPAMDNPGDSSIRGLFANMDDLRAYTDLTRDEMCKDIVEGRYL